MREGIARVVLMLVLMGAIAAAAGLVQANLAAAGWVSWSSAVDRLVAFLNGVIVARFLIWPPAISRKV